MTKRSRKRNTSVTPPSTGAAQDKESKKKHKREGKSSMASNEVTSTLTSTTSTPTRSWADIPQNPPQTLLPANVSSGVASGLSYTPGRVPSYTVLQNVTSIPSHSMHPENYMSPGPQLVYRSPPSCAEYPLPPHLETPEHEPTAVNTCTVKVPVQSALTPSGQRTQWDHNIPQDSPVTRTMGDSSELREMPHREQSPWIGQLLTTMGEMRREMMEMNKKMSRLEVIENRISAIDREVKELKKLAEKVDTLESSVQFLSDMTEEAKRTAATNTQDIRKINSDLHSYYVKIKEIEDRVIDCELRGMRDNLLFSGLKETGPDENPEEIVAQFLHQELQIQDKISFERVHRLGRYQSGKCRPIVAKFSYFKDRERVRRSGPKLAGKPYGLHEQFPREINERRRALMPMFKQEKSRGGRATFVVDKLITDRGKFYVDASGTIRQDQNFRPRPGIRYAARDQGAVKPPGQESRDHQMPSQMDVDATATTENTGVADKTLQDMTQASSSCTKTHEAGTASPNLPANGDNTTSGQSSTA